MANVPENETSGGKKVDERESTEHSSDKVDAPRPGLGKEADIVFTLAKSGSYRQFLERFLDASGQLLRIPWWAVHLALYLATSIAFIWLVSVPKLYPGGRYVSFGAEQIAEFMFTTFMLYHLREARRVAFLAAARIGDGVARLFWLRAYLGPASWGWVVRRAKPRLIIRPWFAAAVMLSAYWGSQYVYRHIQLAWLAHPHSYWDASYPYPEIIHFYPTLAKASLIVAAVAHFWWLYGLTGLVRGRFSSTLDDRHRRLLYFECGRSAVRLSLMVTVATVLWVVARALNYTPTFWVYLYSLWLIVLFATQVVIIKGLKPLAWINLNFFRELIAPDFAVSWEFAGIRRFATLAVLWGLMISVGPLAQLAAAVAKSQVG